MAAAGAPAAGFAAPAGAGVPAAAKPESVNPATYGHMRFCALMFLLCVYVIDAE